LGKPDRSLMHHGLEKHKNPRIFRIKNIIENPEIAIVSGFFFGTKFDLGKLSKP